MTAEIQIWEVLLIGWGEFSTNQKHYPDQGSDTSSLWNFCARSSDVISQGYRRWRNEMLAVFSGYILGSLTNDDGNGNGNENGKKQ